MTDLPNGFGTLVQVTREGMGDTDPELGLTLLRKWLTLVLENDRLPGAVAFYARGVHLVVAGSPVLDLLQAYEARGVPLIVCSTCLEHFDLRDSVVVGIVGGMTDIIAAQWKAEKVVNL